MDHFKGVNETERYNNDLLNEIRKLNENMSNLFDRNAQTVKQLKGDDSSDNSGVGQKRKEIRRGKQRQATPDQIGLDIK